MNKLPNIDLISLVESDLGPGKRSGRWMIYRCPFPAGHKHGDKKPSFRVTNGDHDRPPWWKCFGCGKGGGAVKWLMEYRGLSYADSLIVLKISPDQAAGRRTFEPPIQQPDLPPGAAWQTRALQLIERAEVALWDARGERARTWLQARGLKDDTIRKARLGFIPKDFTDQAEAWGKPNDDDRPLYFPSGMLIPGLIASKVWYLKIRPLSGSADQKYKHVRGGRQALYQADSLTKQAPAVFCEGEFDALLLRQEASALANVITLASATGDLNLATWGLYLLRPSSFILAYDSDAAGEEGSTKLTWLHNSQRLKIPQLQPGDKDLTDFHKSGGNLYSMIENALSPDAPIYVTWSADAKPATVPGQQRRAPDGSIEAFYSADELDYCLGIMHALTSERSSAQ
jgi:hypothetical protein